MSMDSHLFLDALEQVKEILSSPDFASRALKADMTDVISEFCELTDQYAVQQMDDKKRPEDIADITSILIELASKIEVIEEHNIISLQKLKFLSEVSPKS